MQFKSKPKEWLAGERKMRVHTRALRYTTIAYIYIPIVLFLFTWMRLWAALPCTIVWACCAYRMHLKERAFAGDQVFCVDPLIMIISILFFLWIGYFAGWGRWVDQPYDWYKHNAVLSDMVSRSWPVYYRSESGEHSMLAYYVAQYMVPALIGKMMHSFRIGEIMVFVWNEIGLLLVFLNVINFMKTRHYLKQLLIMIMLPFFQVPLWLAEMFLQLKTGLFPDGTGQWFGIMTVLPLQYSSNYTLLRWVFPQTLVIWLIVLLFLQHRNKIEYYLPLMIPAMMYGTLSFIGIIPLALGQAVAELVKSKNFKSWIKSIFSLENLLFFLTMGGVFFLYFYGNIFGEKTDSVGFMIMPFQKDTYIFYVIFVMINVLPYAIVLWSDRKRDVIFYVVVLLLLILPLIKMGFYNDLMMRASIPSLFVLMLFSLSYLFEHIQDQAAKLTVRRKLAVTLLCAVMLFGMYYPFREFSSSVQSEDYHALGAWHNWEGLEQFADRSRVDITADIRYNYFAYDIDDNLFYKYLARVKDQ